MILTCSSFIFKAWSKEVDSKSKWIFMERLWRNCWKSNQTGSLPWSYSIPWNNNSLSRNHSKHNFRCSTWGKHSKKAVTTFVFSWTLKLYETTLHDCIFKVDTTPCSYTVDLGSSHTQERHNFKNMHMFNSSFEIFYCSRSHSWLWYRKNLCDIF